MKNDSAIILIDKDSGPSSFDIVKAVKKVVGSAFKVGHGGSLDPFAKGLLVILIGKATKLSASFLNADKSYQAEVKLGSETNTMDLTGNIINESEVPDYSESHIREVLNSFLGNWNQTPPPFSAKKIHGVRLYNLARKEILVKCSPTTVKIYSIELTRFHSPFIEFKVFCSKGTYLRSMADEIGKRLGIYAHLHSLNRTSCGFFSIEEAIKLDDFIKDPYFHFEKGYINYTKLLQYEFKRSKSDHLQKMHFADNFFSA